MASWPSGGLLIVMADTNVLDHAPELNDARRLAESLGHGAQLKPLVIEGLPLAPGERAYAEVDVEAWRWLSLEVLYEHRSMMVSGPVLTAVSALASAAGNRRRRLAAERAASSQWRPLGIVRVVATDGRLIVWHEGDWWSVSFDTVAAWQVDPDACAVTLSLKEGAPYRLAGPSVPLLAVVLAWLSARLAPTH